MYCARLTDLSWHLYTVALDGLIASILFICMSLWIKASAKRLNVKQKTMLVTAQVLYILLIYTFRREI